MTACVYDNPATMAREMWLDGRMVGHTQAALLCSKSFRGHRTWHFAFNVGPWTPNQVLGNRDALRAPIDTRTKA